MNFNSLTFFVFLGVVLVLHRALPWRFGRWMLVAASYVFYGAANPWYCFLLLLSTLIDFVAAKRIPLAATPRGKKRLLLLSLALNLGLLGTFKYSGFVAENLNRAIGLVDMGLLPVPEWILPVGISFYTFQTLSYTIDVYRGKMAPTKDFAEFALYVAYFPQLVAGPIERAGNLLPQLREKQPTTAGDIETGFQRILWGLVKKVVFADRLALMVDQVYADPSGAGAPVLVVATLCFTLQLYLDFSAYTDIALGVARLMGVKLMENFNWPFLARNAAEFWSRWHISLTTWFRDYVYKPLGGAPRGRPLAAVMNVLFVMALMGFWHGASWNFIVVGLLAGAAVAAVHYLRLYSERGRRGPLFGRLWWSTALAIALTFAYTNFVLIFFRSPDLGSAWEVISGIATNPWRWDDAYDLQLALAAFVAVVHVARGTLMSARKPLPLSPPLRGAFWFALFMLVLYGAVEKTEKFVYFQF